MNLLFVASDPMEFQGILARATEVDHAILDKAKPLTRWSRFVTLNGNQILLVANGAGPTHAAAATDAGVRAFRPQAIVSTGFCGALSPMLGIADLVSGTSVETGSGQDAGQGTRLSIWPGVKHATGAVQSIPYIAQTAAQKRNLAQNGAIAVEMELAGIMARAQAYRLPVYCIRAVTDLAGEDLANDFNKALRSDGQFDTILILKGSLRQPVVRLPELFRLRKRCDRAAQALGDFFANSGI